MKNEILCVIPARGGSKGIPSKNIQKICGKPLIQYTIETAKNSKLISRIIISTDSEKIAKIARKLGVEVPFMRPKKISNDSANKYNGNNSLDILRKLYDQIIKESLTSDYPSFSNLGESLKMLDKVVKMIKVGEKNKAIKYIDDFNSNNNMTKTVSWAVLNCLNSTSSRAWKYSKEEKSLGESISKQMNLLLDSKPETYKECFESISEFIGLGNKLEVI